MLLGIILIVAALAGLIYGITQQNKTLTISSGIGLIIIALLWGVYSYLYSLNSY